MTLSLVIPIRTISEANVRSHFHAKAKRVKEQRSVARWTVGTRWRSVGLPCVVKLTRVAPKELDDDNLRSALKAIRDGVADALGIDDRDSRVTWDYAQQPAARRRYAVSIEIRKASESTESGSHARCDSSGTHTVKSSAGPDSVLDVHRRIVSESAPPGQAFDLSGGRRG